MIQARNVMYSIGGKVLVNCVSLHAAAGEILALVGANGAGKSTLLKILSGELKPHQGSVQLDNLDVDQWALDKLARHRAVLPQRLEAPALTVTETVALGRTPYYKITPRSSSDAESVKHALEEAGLTSRASRLVPTLSGGETQRVHLARVRVQLQGDEAGSRFCFLDEPTSALDMAYQLDLMQSLVRWAAEGWGIVVVLHDLNLAARFADRLAVLQGGRLIAYGSPQEIMTTDLLRQAFHTVAEIFPHPVFSSPHVFPLEPQKSLYETKIAR